MIYPLIHKSLIIESLTSYITPNETTKKASRETSKPVKMIYLLLILGVVGGTHACHSVPARNASIPVRKEGVCPFVPPWEFCPPHAPEGWPELLPTNCHSDGDCPGVAKCCASQATNCGGADCVTDLRIKVVRPGQCPSIDGPAICDSFKCSEDAHCPEHHKCCTNGCGSTECIDVTKSLGPADLR